MVFAPLTKDQIGNIVDLQLDLVARRLKDQRGISVKFTERAKKLLAEKGYDPMYGARPLKRVIQQLVLDPLALKVVGGEVKEDGVVTIDAKKDEIEVKVK